MKKIFIAAFAMVLLVFFCVDAFPATGKEYFDYGKILLNKGDAKRAVKYFDAAVKMEPRNPDYYRAMGDCYSMAGNKAMADKYYAQADKLGGSRGASKVNEVKAEIILFSGGTSTSGTSTFVPVFALSYTRFLNPLFDITGSIGYAYGGNQTAGVEGSSVSLSGGGILLQAKCNWHLDNIIKGSFIGPNIAYLPMTYQYKIDLSGYSGTESVYNIGMSMIMGGMQLGYTYAFDNGFKLTGFLCYDIASETVTTSGSGLFGSLAASQIGLLQFYGVSAGYSF